MVTREDHIGPLDPQGPPKPGRRQRRGGGTRLPPDAWSTGRGRKPKRVHRGSALRTMPYLGVKTTRGAIHTSVLRRFTPAFLLIRRRGNVLRRRHPVRGGSTGGRCRGLSDPPAPRGLVRHRWVKYLATAWAKSTDQPRGASIPILSARWSSCRSQSAAPIDSPSPRSEPGSPGECGLSSGKRRFWLRGTWASSRRHGMYFNRTTSHSSAKRWPG